MESLFGSSDGCCQLQQYNNELEDVDMDLATIEQSSSVARPNDIKPIAEFIAISSASDAASITKTGELGISRDDVTDADRPRSVFIGQDGSQIFEFKLDRRRQRDYCFRFPNERGHFT
jgi:hypothetical protein